MASKNWNQKIVREEDPVKVKIDKYEMLEIEVKHRASLFT